MQVRGLIFFCEVYLWIYLFIFFYVILPPTKTITTQCLQIGCRPSILCMQRERENERMTEWRSKSRMPSVREKQMGEERRDGGHERKEAERVETMDNVKNLWTLQVTSSQDSLQREVSLKPLCASFWRCWGNGVNFRTEGCTVTYLAAQLLCIHYFNSEAFSLVSGC